MIANCDSEQDYLAPGKRLTDWVGSFRVSRDRFWRQADIRQYADVGQARLADAQPFWPNACVGFVR